MKQKLQGAPREVLNQAKRFSRFIFAAVLASLMLPAFAQTTNGIQSPVDASDFSPTYDGTDKKPTIAQLGIYDTNTGARITSGVKVEITSANNTTVTPALSAGTNAGRVEFKVVDDGGGYGTSVATGSYTINKAEPTADHLVASGIQIPGPHTYNGVAQVNATTITAAFKPGLDNGASVAAPTVHYTNSDGVRLTSYTSTTYPDSAGTYGVEVEFPAAGINFQAQTVELGEYKILKKNPDINDFVPTSYAFATNIEYTGFPQAGFSNLGVPDLKPNLNNSDSVKAELLNTDKLADPIPLIRVKYVATNPDAVFATPGDTVPAHAGTYAVKAVFAEGNNFFEGTVDFPGTYEIKKAAPTAAVVDFTYPTADSIYSGYLKPLINAQPAAGVLGLGDIVNTYAGFTTGNTDSIPISVGEYQVRFSIAPGLNYKATTTDLLASDIPSISSVPYKIIPKAIGSGTSTPATGIVVDFPNAYVYKGSPHLAIPRVVDASRDNRQLVFKTDFDTVSTAGAGTIYSNNTNASTPTTPATLQIKGIGNYDQTIIDIPFTIKRKQITINTNSNGVKVTPKAYDGTTAASMDTVRFVGLVTGVISDTLKGRGGNLDYSVEAIYSDANVGTGKSVSGVVTLGTTPVAKNYTFVTGETGSEVDTLRTTLPADVTGDIKKAPSSSLAATSQFLNVQAGNVDVNRTFDLNSLELIPGDVGTKSFALATPDTFNVGAAGTNDVIFSGATNHIHIDDGHTLNYSIKSGTVSSAGNAMILVKVTTQNYDTITARLPINVTGDAFESLSFDDRDATFDGITKEATYGDGTFRYPATGTIVGALTYASSRPNVATVTGDGLVTIKNAGKTTITAEILANNTPVPHTGARASYDLIVKKKDLTITAKDTTVLQGQPINRALLLYNAASGKRLTYDGLAYDGLVYNDSIKGITGDTVTTVPSSNILGKYPIEVKYFSGDTLTGQGVNYKLVLGETAYLYVANVPTIKAVTAEAGDSKIKVTVIANPNQSPISSYKVILTDSVAGATSTYPQTLSPALTDSTASTTFTVSATNGVKYKVEVVAQNGLPSPSATWTVPYRVTPAAEENRAATPPSNIVATQGIAKATVTFDAADPGYPAKTITGYTVECVEDPAKRTTGSGSPIEVTGLTPGTATFTVKVNFGDGTGLISVASNEVTILAPPPANPTATISTVEPGDGQVKVTFDVVPDGKTPNKYTATSTPEGKTASNTDGSPITVEGLTNGTEYTFKVTVSFDDNDDVTSDASVAVTPTASETPTATITKVEAGDAQVTVTFDVVPAGKTATKYTATCVEDATKTAFNEDGSPITVTDLTNGTPYTFTVTVSFSDNDDVTSAPSEAVTPEDATGINDVEEVATAKLYPNPVRDVVTISGLQGNETIRFYDASGRAVLEHKADASEANITVSQLPKGIYIVRIGTKALKLMKI